MHELRRGQGGGFVRVGGVDGHVEGLVRDLPGEDAGGGEVWG